MCLYISACVMENGEVISVDSPEPLNSFQYH